MDTLTPFDYVKKRLGAMESARGTWEDHWQEILDYVMPRKADVTLVRAKGEKRTDYVDPETGEIFGKPTERQIKQAATNLRARGKTSVARELDAFLEEQRIKAGKLELGESGVGPRQGSRGMASGIRAEDRASIKDPINKRAKGGYMKKPKGSMDYRMGGMVISSVDNRKKK